jgi:phosphatidate cytidylyltransferase
MTRLLTGIALIVVAAYLVFLAPSPIFFGAAVLMSLLCYREFSGLVACHGIENPGVLGVLAGIIILFWPAYTLIGISLVFVVAFTAALRTAELRQILPQVAAIILAAFYTFAPWHFAAELRTVSVHLLFFALALNWAGDSVAYYVGRRLGKHKLAPVVSPNKSWEGAAASVAGSVFLGVLYLHFFESGIAIWKVVVMAIVGNIAGQLGDLAESAVKRGAGVKDSGQLLPGHGGMLDRVDSSLFALPVVYTLVLVLRSW